MTISADLDLIQAKLHDSATLWPRAELLRWYNDGYRELLAKTQAVRQLHIIDVPPRYSYTYTYEWEKRHTQFGPSRMIFWPAKNATVRVTSLWEAEQLEGVTPTASFAGKTQEWERAHGNETDRQYIFALPHQHDLVLRVAWDGKRLHPVTVREFDETDDAWMRRDGEPWWWTPGLGRINSIEIYEIVTSYTQAYQFVDAERFGFARGFAGSRTYTVKTNERPDVYGYTTSGDADAFSQDTSPFLTTLGFRFTQDAVNDFHGTQVWEKEFEEDRTRTTFTAGVTVGTYLWEEAFGAVYVALGIGTLRFITSPDRQYWPYGHGASGNTFLGGVRSLRSSDDSIELWHVVVPHFQLTADDTPDLIPSQVQKYLRYYVLWRAFGRSGPGNRPDLASHYRDRFDMGVFFLKRLADIAHRDHVYVRESIDIPVSGRPPYVRLPAAYPEVF